jgi:hypothetical protein
MGDSTGEDGDVKGGKLGKVAHSPVDDYSVDAPALGEAAKQTAHDRPVGLAAGVNDKYVPGHCKVGCLVNHEIVTGAGLYCQSPADQANDL